MSLESCHDDAGILEYQLRLGYRSAITRMKEEILAIPDLACRLVLNATFAAAFKEVGTPCVALLFDACSSLLELHVPA